MHFGSFESKLFIVEAGEFIKIRYIFIAQFLGRSHDTYTDMTKLVEEWGLVDSAL